MKKKWIASLLILAMTITMMAGCGKGSSTDTKAPQETKPAVSQSQTQGNDESPKASETGTGDTAEDIGGSADTGAWTGDVSHIIVTYLTLGNTPADLQKVQDALNERTVKEIGVEVEFKAVSAFDAMSSFTTWLATGEQIDLMFPLMQSITGFINQGLIDPIEDLIAENAPYIQSLSDEGYTFATNNTLDGHIWSIMQVPSITGMGGGFHINKDYLDEIGFTVDPKKVYTLDDLTEIFAAIKEKHPDVYPCGTVTTAGSQFGYVFPADSLGSTDGGVLMGTDSTTVVNLYETEEYKNYLEHLREWFQAGFIYPDAATTDASNTALYESGVTCGYFMASAPTTKHNNNQAILRLSGLCVTSQAMGGWVIPTTAKEPEAAMRFLNLMYEDASIANLIQWGIEGEHYVMVDESKHLIGFPEGIDGTTSGYYNTLGLYGDTREIYVWSEDTVQAENDAYSEEAMKNKTKGVGFIYNPSDAMATKITAITTVVQQYAPALEAGTVDVDQYYPKFIADLKAAGIDEVIAEKQAQFDEFLKQ